MTRIGTHFWPLLLAAALPLAGSCATTSRDDTMSRITDLVRQGRYDAALQGAEKLAASHPGEARYQEFYRDIQVHEMLSRARREVFDEHPEAGLAILDEAFKIDPQNGVVFSWIQKIRIQLAEDWLNRAAELRNRDKLEQARVAYEASLTYVPPTGDRAEILANEAKLGLSRVLLLQNYRSGLSKTHFDSGLRSFQRYLLHQARHAFSASESYDPRNERATVRGGQVDELLAEERLALAQGFEAEGLYFAARNEYRLVLLVDPDSAEAKAGLDRMDREVRATQAISEAEMQIRRGDLEAAGELLAETQGFTEVQGDVVQRLEGQIEDRSVELKYLEARNFEHDYRYHEAVAAYEALLEERPYYEDATARKKTIEEFIALTEEAYEKALAATDDEEAIGYLRQIQEIYWPEYLDVPERLATLLAGRAASEPDEGGQ